MKRNRATSRIIWCTVLVLLLAADPAKSEIKPINPSKIEDIKALIHLIRLEKIVMLAAENTLERFFPILKKATAQNNRAVSETVFAILKSSTLSMVKRQISAKNGLIDRVIPLYNKHYTHSEIRSLIQFYESPLGKKVTALRPQITQEGMVVAEEWINFLKPLLVQALAKSLEKEGYAIIKKPPN